MPRILVFPCANGVGQEIYFALRYIKDMELYGANDGNTNIGHFLYSNYISDMPAAGGESIKEFLKQVIRFHGIQFIIPTSGEAQIAAHNAQTAAIVVASPLITTGICQSKKAIYELCGKGGIRVPEIYADIDESSVRFPVYVKPDKGGEQRRMFSLVNSKTELARLPQGHVITEYLPGEEFTVDCLTDTHGKLLFYGARRRTLTHAGVSILNETIDRSIFEAFTARVNAQMRFVGAWFLQCIYDRHGQLCLVDVNPRIAGAMSIYRNLGVNFPLVAMYIHMNKKPVDILWMDIPAKCAKIYHNHLECPSLEYDTVCVDLDETLILQDGRVNHRLIGFLYKSMNEGKRIYLITRHRGDVQDTLASKRIHAQLFDKIVQLPQGPNKGDYMPPRSILIDDSFRERKKVKDAHPSVYVFDVDALDMLVNSCPRNFLAS